MLKGMGFCSREPQQGTRAAVSGLGSLLAPKSKTVITKQTRQVVGDFVKGFSSKGSCSRKTGECAIESDGLRLKVDGEVLAERPSPSSDMIKVCIPARASYEQHRDGRTGKTTSRETTQSSEIKAAGAALLRILGTGLTVRSPKGIRQLTSGRTRARSGRVLMPGECVRVQLTPAMQQAATDMQMATNVVVSRGEKPTKAKVRAEAKRSAKARETERQERIKTQRAANLAKARAARSGGSSVLPPPTPSAAEVRLMNLAKARAAAAAKREAAKAAATSKPKSKPKSKSKSKSKSKKTKAAA